MHPAPANPNIRKKTRPKWETFKHEVQQLYLHEDKTLAETMTAIELRHGFTASVRTWKSVIKEWGFDKHLPSDVMKFVVTKQGKRLREEGKETVFIHGNSVIAEERIENFKKRKATRECGIVSPIPATPAEITYGTPQHTVKFLETDSGEPSFVEPGVSLNPSNQERASALLETTKTTDEPETGKTGSLCDSYSKDERLVETGQLLSRRTKDVPQNSIFIADTISAQDSPGRSSGIQMLPMSGPLSNGHVMCKKQHVNSDHTESGYNSCQSHDQEWAKYTNIRDANQEMSKSLRPGTNQLLPTSILPSLAFAVSADSETLKYLERYYTAKVLTYSFDARFWTKAVTDCCLSAAPATAALPALAKSFEASRFLSKPIIASIEQRSLDQHRRDALKRYSKAVSSLQTMLGAGLRHLRISLTACVLFMGFEALSGNYEGLLIHLRGGLELLTDWRRTHSSFTDRISQNTRLDILDTCGHIDDLGKTFLGLDIPDLFVNPSRLSADLCRKNFVFPEHFDCTQEAKKAWDFLMSGISQLYRLSCAKLREGPDQLLTAGWTETRKPYTAQLLRWRFASQAVHLKEDRTRWSDESTFLHICDSLATILVCQCSALGHAFGRIYSSVFRHATNLTHLMSNTNNHINATGCILDLDTILSLAFTTIKCRLVVETRNFVIKPLDCQDRVLGDIGSYRTQSSSYVHESQAMYATGSDPKNDE